MKFSWQFLKEFLDLKISPSKLASLLTMTGLEITSIKKEAYDVCFEAEVTSNRPDLLSILGIAYEVAALTGKKVKNPVDKIQHKPLLNLSIEIENKADCPLYIGRLVKGVKIGPSPAWLRERLSCCGINSVNNVVDITNYCMLKWGQPLHAFDVSKIKEKIVVRRAKKHEKIICIDNRERTLSKEILVIADKDSVLALAGIMGARNSEVTDTTQDVLIEAAIFSGLPIRRGRRLLGIDTESSYRFERGINPLYIEQASFEAAQLMAKLAKGEIAGYRKQAKAVASKSPIIKFDTARMNHFLGTNISEGETLKILKKLNCKIEKRKKSFYIARPPNRADIKIEEDLFEEIARIWGYQHIPAQLPSLLREIKQDASFYKFKEKIRDKLIRLGVKEIVTFSIVQDKDSALHLTPEEGTIKIVNPLRANEDRLRSQICVGMLQALRYNVYRKERKLAFFEIADSYLKNKKSFKETPKVCIGQHSDNINDFYIFKAKIEAFFKELGIDNICLVEKEKNSFSNFCSVGTFGWLGILKPGFCKKLDLAYTFLAEFDLALIYKRAKINLYKKINYFPWVERDISLALGRNVKFQEVESIVKAQAGSLLKRFELVDIYRGEKIPKDFIGFTLRIFYQHPERTLESAEVDDIHFKLREALAKKERLIVR